MKRLVLVAFFLEIGFVLIVIPLATQPPPVPLTTAPGPAGRACVFESDLTLPAGVTMSVSGVSAETDQALPYGPL